MKKILKIIAPIFLTFFLAFGTVQALSVLLPQQGGTGTGTVFTSGSIPVASTNGIYTQDNTNFVYTTAGGLRVGPTTTAISSENKISAIANTNDYHGYICDQINAGTLASCDYILGNDLTPGDNTSYGDLTINSSGNTNAAMTGFAANDVSLFTSGQIKGINIATGGNNPIDFMTNGYLTANKRMRIDGAGLVGIGTGTNAITGKLTLRSDALGATAGADNTGVRLENTTAAAAGAQQVSPGLIFSSSGWGTTAPGAQNVSSRIMLFPIQGTANPTSNLQFQSSINGAAYATLVTFSSAGSISAQASILGGAAGSNAISFGSVGVTNFSSINSNIGPSTASALYQIAGSTAVNLRNAFGGSVSSIALTVGNSYTGSVFGNSAITTAASGTHAWLANVAIKALGTVTSGGATVTNTASLYIDGPGSGGTNNYSVYVASGLTSLQGNLTVVGTTTLATSLTGILSGASGVVSAISTTGSGNVVLATSPTLVTPALGTPSALVGTNITGTGTGFTSGSSNALQSATTTVNTSSATAPSLNQILTATSSTTATWQAVKGVSGYNHGIFTPTTGQTITLTNNQYNIVNPAGALLALTVNLPSTPSNNDVVYIKFTQTVTTVTYANGTVVDGITGPAAGGLVVLTYDSGTTSWY